MKRLFIFFLTSIVFIIFACNPTTVDKEPAPITGPLFLVEFEDSYLEASVRTALSKPTGDIYNVDVEALHVLNASSMNISLLSGLEHFTSLSELYLQDNQISDPSPLHGLSALQILYIYNNSIAQVDRNLLQAALPDCTIKFEPDPTPTPSPTPIPTSTPITKPTPTPVVTRPPVVTLPPTFIPVITPIVLPPL